MNGAGDLSPLFVYSQQLTKPSADTLGGGSVRASNDPSTLGNDGPFWDALTANVKNLHAIISGHGTFCHELLQSGSKACLQTTGTNGVLANPRKTLFSALTSTLGSFLFPSCSPSPSFTEERVDMEGMVNLSGDMVCGTLCSGPPIRRRVLIRGLGYREGRRGRELRWMILMGVRSVVISGRRHIPELFSCLVKPSTSLS